MKVRLMPAVLVVIACAAPALGQQAPAGDQEAIRARQELNERFAAAVANKNVAAALTNLAADAVLQSLCPESPLAYGPEEYAKRLEGALKAQMRDYSARVKEAHLLKDGVAWTTGSYTFTVNDKEGKPEQVRGNWLDMLRREGTEWKISFQAYPRTPCP
jgi:ketosteroid isomerase-like protein